MNETLKKECFCEAEIFIAKRHLTNKPKLSWNRVYDLQDNISYVVEFDDKEYVCNTFSDERKAFWEIPFELEKRKIYKWRVKAYDGYEYSDYSKYQYLQQSDYIEDFLNSYIYVNPSKDPEVKTLESEINVWGSGSSELKAKINVEHVKKYQPCIINVEIPKQFFLQSEIEVMRRNYRQLEAELFVQTKRLLPPKGPLAVDMQSEFDYVTGNMSPTFSWWKSLDELFSDDIEYEIQISRDVFFIDDVVFYKKNIKNPISEQMVYPLPIRLEKGTYYWRVRTTDGINYSDWVYGVEFTVDASCEELEAEITVFDYFTRDAIVAEIFVKEKNILEAEIEVKGHSNLFLPAIVTVWAKSSSYLECALFLVQGPALSTLNGELEVFNSKLDCECEVYPEGYCYHNEMLECKINIIPVASLEANAIIIPKMESDLSAEINVQHLYYSDLDAKLLVLNREWQGFCEAEVYVKGVTLLNVISQQMAQIDVIKMIQITETSQLLAELSVKHTIKFERTLECKINILVRGGEDLECEIEVLSIRQLPIKIICEQEQDKWYNNNIIGFSWEHEMEHKLLGYLMKFNQIPDYVPKFAKDYYKHAGGRNNFIAQVYDYSGEYYFHIIGFDNEYNLTPVSHYKICYNNKPEAPKHLKINGVEFSENEKVLSKNGENVFSWEKSYDADQNDFVSLKYQLVICNKPNFQYIDYESELIEDTNFKISFKHLNLVGKYYWKVRAFDGKEYSDWSEQSSFKVNNPPSIPTNIEFFGK